MATDINSNIVQGVNKPRVRQLPVSKPAGSQNSHVAENIVQVNFDSRQNVATSRVQKTGQTQADVTEVKQKSIQKTVENLSKNTQMISRKLEFAIDDESGRTVVTVRDSTTKEVIRQIPTEQVLEISSRLKQLQEARLADPDIQAQGILFTTKT